MLSEDGAVWGNTIWGFDNILIAQEHDGTTQSFVIEHYVTLQQITNYHLKRPYTSTRLHGNTFQMIIMISIQIILTSNYNTYNDSGKLCPPPG
jgi:hypothetical protein